ncbi:hypothetical protein PENTCL1PPCAC_21026, partial [Pristionchus entomophagus]
ITTVQQIGSSCFTAAPWDRVRPLIADVISMTSLETCLDSCIHSDEDDLSQCAAASYSPASRCALLGKDTPRSFCCGLKGSLYVRDPECGDCVTPVYVDPGCNSQLHACTEAVRNGAVLECPPGAGGLFLTSTNQ